ncbi:LysE family transporter [Sporolactobacillus vineae]|uniref:LysE family transporter n=1 Tax=Sporolactobacillus vineae TaxID=444463 RepID=UPI000289F98E|nr:LysE family transporter [Sporolactobacillus vineae]
MLGLLLQLSVGPVFFTVLHLSMKKGFREGLKMTAAVALVDALYICLSFTSMSALLQIPSLQKGIGFLAMVVLVYFGITFIRNSGTKSVRQTAAIHHSFTYGLKITLINPLTIVFWSGAFGSLIAARQLTGFLPTILYGAGCVTATILFLGLTSLSGKYLTRLIDPRKLRFVDIAVGVILILFGIETFFTSLF